MNIKNFILSYYNNATEGLHIQKVTNTDEAQHPHTHEYFQIYYLLKGCVTHYIEDVSSILYCGDSVIIPPNVEHHIKITEDVEFFSFSFMPNVLDENSKTNKIAINFLHQLLTLNKKLVHTKIVLPDNENILLKTIFESIYKEFHSKTLGADEIIRANTTTMLTMFARAYFNITPDSIQTKFDNINQFILFCIQYIDNNFTENLSITEMAKRAAMCKSSFCNAFTQITGQSFKKYLNTKRIEYAEKLIKKGYKITAIYAMCGFEDYSTFVRNFKKNTGVSPSQYIKK